MIPGLYGFLRGSLQILIQLGKLLSTRSAGGSGPFRLFQILSSAGFFTARGRGLGVRLEKNGIPGPPSRLHLPMILPSWSLPSFWAGICAFKKFLGHPGQILDVCLPGVVTSVPPLACRGVFLGICFQPGFPRRAWPWLFVPATASAHPTCFAKCSARPRARGGFTWSRRSAGCANDCSRGQRSPAVFRGSDSPKNSRSAGRSPQTWLAHCSTFACPSRWTQWCWGIFRWARSSSPF